MSAYSGFHYLPADSVAVVVLLPAQLVPGGLCLLSLVSDLLAELVLNFALPVGKPMVMAWGVVGMVVVLRVLEHFQ